MIHELLQAISKKDYVSAKGLLEAAFKEKMADALEERRFEIIDEMFNSGLDDEIVEGVSSSSKQNYEYANGHKPKGNGRWMFSTIEPRKHDVRNDEHMKHTFTSDFASFSDASKAAVKHFKSKGHVGDIHVLS